jgi:hypothetical protein
VEKRELNGEHPKMRDTSAEATNHENENAIHPNDSTSNLWITNRGGSGLHKLADDAGRPAWDQGDLLNEKPQEM